jgi:hypothetical protein
MRMVVVGKLKQTRYSGHPIEMSEMNTTDGVLFMRTEVRAGDRLLIKSTCVMCGMAMLLSATDGSLEKWEDWHTCDKIITV